MFLRDEYSPEINFVFEEASEDAGEHILGKIKGQFFVPNGKSRNKRFYSESLWVKTLSNPDVQSKLKNRLMFGTIGHTQKLDNQALSEGKASHIVTSLSIEDGKGMGEALIINTPAGRNLNTYLRAGANLYTSSRADGKYASTKHEGLPVVDEDAYKLFGFDMVIDPGFLEANPELTENLETEETSQESDQMDELTKKILEENAALKIDLQGAIEENGQLKADNSSLLDESAHLKGELKTYKTISTDVEAYRELGSVEQVKTSILEALKFSENVKNEGGFEALVEAKASLEKYTKLGDAGKMEEALTKANELITEYKEIGTPDQIKAVYEKTTGLLESTKAERTEAAIKELAAELKVDEEKIAKVYGKLDEESIRELFAGVNESNKIKSTFKKQSSMNEDKEEGNGVQKGARRKFSQNLTESLVESLSR